MYLSNIGGVFMIEQQQKLMLSPYMEIYELVIPKDNLLRQIKELVDFSFIYDELLANYCLDNGRNAVPPIRMFKYLLLKSIYDLSDVDVVERSKYDMSFKYFLDMAPEDEVINPSSLTKFRKLRLKDMNLLDMLIAKTVQLALEKGIIKSKSIIVDATHTKSRYNQKTPRQVLQEQSKKLRRSIYEIDETMKEKFSDKNTEDSLEKELKYCKQLIDVVKGNEEICSYPKVQEKLNLLEESVTDDMEHLETSKDEDAKTGHKTADTSFFGYKTHIAMTEERIITAATITSGEKTDGKELPKLVQKSKAAGIQIESVIGDMAYSEKKNIEAAKEGAKKKTYTETIICDSHSEQVKFQETEHFKEKMRERYKIEAKNSELKHRHGYDVASSSGLICMEMQGAMTIFAVNLKRIIKLMNEK